MLKHSGLITATILLASEGAFAQQAAPQGTVELDTIVIEDTAQDDRSTTIATDSFVGTKTGTPILDVPASVSVVTEKEMKQRAVNTLDDALAYTSGVVTDSYGSDNRYDYYFIRGFYQTTWGSYRDGMAMPVHGFVGSRMEPYGMERIEVLKGSTSTLFGLNAPGGLVNGVTKKPLPTTFGEVYSTVGENHIEGGLDFGGPIDAEGKWLYRFTTKGQQATVGTEHSDDDRFYIAPALTWQPNESTGLTLLVNYNKRDGNTSHGIPYGSGIDPFTYLGEPDFDNMDTEEYNAGYEFSHDFDSGLQFRQNLRYTDLHMTYESVYGGSANPSTDRSVYAVYGDTRRFSMDNQLQYDADFGPVATRTLAGLDFYYDKTHERRETGTAPGLNIRNPNYCGRPCVNITSSYRWEQERAAIGLYAQEEATFFDKVVVTLGGRYDHVDTNSRYSYLTEPNRSTDDAFTGRAGVTFKARNDLSLYANYSESFLPTSADLTLVSDPEPQRGQQYEAGIKYEPDFMNAMFTLAAFEINQTNVPYDIGSYVYDQIGKVRVRGLEFEGRMELMDGLNMTLAYSYWDPEILQDGASGNEGNRPQLVPNNIASAWVDYTIPGQWKMNDLTIGAGIRYVGETFTDNENTIKLDGRTLVDAAISYDVFENATLQLNATNIFDERYISSVDTFSNTAYYGDGRVIKGTFRYTW
ncbi:TonB-dependent siderophore receptor [Rhodobacterales bacterium]|nr:TonB-dependent siderophore receptor [Rhodobacterales bacterium]